MNSKGQKVIVSKFGGTSMADAEAMRRSAQVSVDHNASVVVVSATSGTTNQLIKLAKMAESGEWGICEEIINEIITKHHKIGDELDINQEVRVTVSSLLEDMSTLARGINLLKDCSPKAMDNMMAFGERLSSTLFTVALDQTLKMAKGPKNEARFFDVRKVLRTDDRFGTATPQFEEIRRLSEQYLSDCRDGKHVYATQGFIGMTEEGHTTTLGRGGSDYSAAILAEAIDADILEIWTDVAGIATTDPRICPKAYPIPEITFQEAAELATFGAKILHPTTLSPAMRKDIPVFVGSSFEAQKKGTWIKKNIENAPLVRAMALRKNQCLVTLRTPKMLNAYGFLYSIFKVFNDHKVSIDLVTTSEISVSVTLNDSSVLTKNLLKELSTLADVSVEENLSLVSIIGNNINHTAGLSRLIFTELKDINIRMICSGASKHHFCFLVGEKSGEESIARLHKMLIEEGTNP